MTTGDGGNPFYAAAARFYLYVEIAAATRHRCLNLVETCQWHLARAAREAGSNSPVQELLAEIDRDLTEIAQALDQLKRTDWRSVKPLP